MVANIIVIIFLSVGCFFFVIGTTGLFRLPDIFSRLHLATKCDTLGAISVLVAAAISAGWSFDILRLVVISLLLLISSATCGHAIGRSAIKNGLKYFRKEPPAINSGKVAKSAPGT